MNLSNNQRSFIEFLVTAGALSFGEFVLKSGRKAPYFINTGKFDDGEKIGKLGAFYAQHIVENKLSNATTIFGPAYKGIPLCVATAAALHTDHKLTIGFSFDRKEAKTHGDGGRIVGKKVGDGDRIILVEDVITAGTTMRDIIPLLQSLGRTELLGVVIAVDRCERGSGDLSAVQEVEKQLGLKVFPIVTVHGIVQHLSNQNPSGLTLSAQQKESISAYLETYGAK